MVQVAVRGAPAAAAAHHEQPHRRFRIVGAAQHRVEEPQPVAAPIARPTVQRGVRPELHVAEAGLAAVAVGPWPQDQPLPAASGLAQPGVVLRRRQRIRVEPGRHVNARRGAVARVVPGGPQAQLLPIGVERAMPPLLEQIRLVIRMVPQRRVARLPRHAGEPVAQVLVGQGGAQHRVRLGFRRQQRLVVGPTGLLQLERAELADAAGPGIAEPAAVQHLRHQARRVQAPQRRLGVGGVAEPHGADAPVAPGLPQQPGAGVEAVLGIGQIFDETPLGPVAAAAILEHHSQAAGSGIGGPRRTPDRAGRRLGQFAAARLCPAIRGAFQHHRERARAAGKVDVGGKAYAVADGDHGSIHGPCSSGSAPPASRRDAGANPGVAGS